MPPGRTSTYGPVSTIRWMTLQVLDREGHLKLPKYVYLVGYCGLDFITMESWTRIVVEGSEPSNVPEIYLVVPLNPGCFVG